MFADINQDYPIDQSLEYCLEKIEAKPFSSRFRHTVGCSRRMYGVSIWFQFNIQRYSDILTEEFGKLSQGSNKTRGAAVKRADA